MINDTRTEPDQHLRAPKNRRVILCRFEYLIKPIVDCDDVLVIKDRRVKDRRAN